MFCFTLADVPSAAALSRKSQNFLTNIAQRGLTAIEIALALPVVTFFIVGAVDISRSMKAYSALQEGVRSALRCSYTTDGDCVQATPPIRDAFYRWYELTGTSSPAQDYFSYAGAVNWIGAPRERATEAWVLGSVNYRYPNQSYSFIQDRVPANQPLRVVAERARAPFLDLGNDPATQSINARVGNMTYRGSSEGWPADRIFTSDYGTNGFLLNTNDETINFTITGIPRPRVSIDSQNSNPVADVAEATLCKETIRHNWAPGESLENNSITLSNADGLGDCQGSERAVVVHVRGTAGGSGTGTVELRLGGKGQGGQAFGDSGPASFYPRGLPDGHVSPASAAGWGEFQHGLIHVTYPPGQATGTLAVQIKLTERTGTANWQLDAIRILLPDYRIVDLSVPCVSGVSTEAIQSGSQQLLRESCALPNPFQTAHRLNIPAPNLPAPVQVHCQPSESAARSQLNSNLGFHLQQAYYENSCPKINAATASCAQPNPGVNEVGSVIAGNPSARRIAGANSEATALCPVPAGIAAAADFYTESLTAMSPSAQYDLTQTSCSAPITRPAGLSYYRKPKIETSSVDISGHGPNVNPHQDPEYACAGFIKKRAVLTQHPSSAQIPGVEVMYPPLPQGSLFAGVHPELASSCMGDRLRTAAIEALNAMPNHPALNPAEIFFAADTPAYSHTEFGEGSCQAEQEHSQQSCTTFRCARSLTAGRVLLTPDPLPGEEPPARCRESGVSCMSEFVRFEGSAGSVTTSAQTARDQAYNLIETLYPQAQSNCVGANCVNVNMVDDGTSVRANATMDLPLAILMGNQISLGFSEQRELERGFVR